VGEESAKRAEERVPAKGPLKRRLVNY